MRIWILQRWQVYARVTLLAGIVLGPTLFHRGTQDVFNLLKLTTIMISAIAAAALFAAWSSERAIWPPKFNLLFAAGAFLGACLLATLFSQNRVLSVIGLYHRYGGLIPFMVYALVMLLIVGLYWERPGDLRDIAKASALASTLLLSYVLIQAAGRDWIPWKDSTGNPPPYPVGTMGNSNFAGGYLGIALPFLFYVAMSAKNDFMRTLLFVLVGLDVLALWFTQTRGGMIAAVTGAVAMVFLSRDRLPRWTKVVTAVAMAIGVILAVLVLWHPGMDEPPGPLAKVETFRTQTFGIRTYYWQTGLRIFADKPILGSGLELYYARYPQFRLPEDGAQLGLTITDKPHNIFVEYLANAGLLGGLSYLLLVGLALWYAARRVRTLEGEQRLLLTVFAGVLAGYLGQGFFSIDVPPLAVMGWVAIGGIAVFADPKLEAAREKLLSERKQSRPGKKQRRKDSVGRVRVARQGPLLVPIHAGLAVLVIGFSLIAVRPLLADARARESAVAQNQQGKEAEAEAEIKKAIRWHPLEAQYRAQAGSISEARATAATDPAVKRRWLADALDHYEDALRIQDGNIFYMMNIARVYTQWGTIEPSRYKEADKWWKRVVDNDPTDWDVHNRYAIMLNEYANATGNAELRKRSLTELERVVEIKPEFVAAWLNIAKVYISQGNAIKAKEAIDAALRAEPNNAEALKLKASVTSTSTASAPSGG
ncbi:MAG TPA: O-antigen ligase family protein [Actinomycetota bacterium]|nr:O-antigen ligase family protein [Actinomycetota bacterium]